MRKGASDRDWDLWTKENQVSALKKQLLELKGVEYDFFKLNDEIVNIEAKYDMLLDEQKRSQHEMTKKLQINRKNLADLKADVANIKNQIDVVSIQISNSIKDNSTLKKICDNRESEIASLNIALNELQKTNQIQNEQYEKLSMTLKSLKEEKERLEQERDRITKTLEQSVEELKELEKMARKQESNYKNFQTTLMKIEQENKQLAKQMGVKEEALSLVTKKYETVCQQINEVQESNIKLEQECRKIEQEYKDYSSSLQKAQSENKEKAEKLKVIDENLIQTEEQLSAATKKRDNLKLQHQNLITKNKDLNSQIDSYLMKVIELKKVNQALQNQIQNYITCDQEARILLDRKEKMRQLLQTVDSKLLKTSEPIAQYGI